MTDKPSDTTIDNADGIPDNPGRRRVLGGMALAGAAITLGGCRADGTRRASAATQDDAALDASLREHIHTVVVLYAENRSFNNLFAGFPGLAQPLKALDSPEYRQRDRDGGLLATLPPIWSGLVPHPQVVDGQHFHIDEHAITGLPNQPFALRTPQGAPLPHGVVTRDLIHRFYENQLQINGGRNDGFVAWGNTGAMVMGHYADTADRLRLWRHRQLRPRPLRRPQRLRRQAARRQPPALWRCLRTIRRRQRAACRTPRPPSASSLVNWVCRLKK